MRPGARTIAIAIAVATSVLYGWRLSDAPIYISPDEAIISVDAHSLASTGRDVRGQLFPLYFQIQLPGETRMGWFTPAIFYLMALFLKVLPLSEAVVRMPTVLIGVTDVVLMYFVGRRLFQREWLAILAAALLALTPAHFMLSRYALDYLYPLPFTLGWLLCLFAFLDDRRPSVLFAATLLLGIGFFSYIAAVVMMPLYFLATGAAIWRKPAPWRELAIAAAGFGLPLLMLVAWLPAHPTAVTDTIARYDLYDTKQLNALQGLRSFLTYPNLERLASLYWSFFNPSFLFFSGDRQMMFSTRSIGVFALAVAPLLLLGLYHVVIMPARPAALIALFGLVTAPVAALLGGEGGVIIRAVALIPFTVLLATFGVEFLWSRRVGQQPRPLRWQQAAAVALLALVALQFRSFASDYFNDYRLRSSTWLGGNLRGALENLIEMESQQKAPRIYFSTLASTGGLMDIRNRWMDTYWRFYLIKHRREDLLARSGPLETGHVHDMPEGSLVLANIGEVNMDSLVKSGELKRVKAIPEVSGPEFFSILQR